MLRNRVFPSRRFTYAMFIASVQANKGMKVNEGRKHPPYCLFSRETRALTDLTSYVAQLALYEPKSEANTALRASLPCLTHKAPVMQAKPICKGTVRPWIIEKLLLSMVQLSHGRSRLID